MAGVLCSVSPPPHKAGDDDRFQVGRNSFPPIPIAEIDSEKEWVLDYNKWEHIQLHRKDASND